MLDIEAKKVKLDELYEEIYHCKICHEDKFRVKRALIESALKSKIFLIGEALAGKTQRKSGIPYTYEDKRLSKTGDRLDKFLNLFNYTINSSGTSRYQYVYSSDIVQCLPAEDGNFELDKNWKPKAQVKKNCVDFVIREIKIIEPKLILLAGKVSRDTFYNNFRIDDASYERKSTKHIDKIIISVEIPQMKLDNLNLYVLPIIHPSPRTASLFNKKQYDMLKYSVIDRIVKILN